MIIAVAILAVVVIPLLRSFVISSRANTVARQKLQANTVAQNLMEDVKACDMEDISKWFQDHQGITLKPVTEEMDKKVYTTTGLVLNGNQFDARITIDGSIDSEYRTEDGAGYNDEQMANLPDMDSDKAAVYAMGASEDEDIAKQYKTLHDAYDVNNSRPMNVQDFLADFTRTIRIQLQHDPASGTSKVMMHITYVCSAGLVDEKDRTITRTLSLYDNTGSENELSSICLFYTPLYSSRNGDKDIIQLENTDNYPINFYLVKMNAQSNTGADSGYLESVYKAGLEVTESGTESDKSASRICTNLYDKAAPKYVLSYSGDLEKLENNTTSAENPQEQMRIFAVTIDVYEKNSEFDDSRRMVTLTGSRS